MQELHGGKGGAGRHEFVIGSHELRTIRSWALCISQTMGREFLKSAGARISDPAPAIFSPSVEPPLDTSSVILLPAGSLLSAAIHRPRPAAAGTSSSFWPMAAGPSSPTLRLEAIVFGSREPMYLALAIDFISELPAPEGQASKDAPAEAGARPLEMRVAAWPVHPAMADAHVGKIPSRIPETRFLPASFARTLADSVGVSLQAHNQAAQTSATAAPIASAAIPATLERMLLAPPAPRIRTAQPARPTVAAQDSAGRSAPAGGYVYGASQLRMPVLEMALATEPARKALPEVLGVPISTADWKLGLVAEAAERFVLPETEVALSFATEIAAPQFEIAPIGSAARPRISAGPVAAPAAEPAARFVLPAMAAAAAYPMREAALPPLHLPIALPQEPETAAWMPTPAAEAAERWVQPVVAAAIAAPLPVAAPQIAALTLAPLYEPPVILGTVPVPAAEPAARFVQPAVAAAIAAPLPVAAPQIAALTLPPLYEPTVILGTVPVPAAEPAARFVQPAVAEAQAAAIDCAVPALDLTVAAPDLPFIVEWMQPAAAELVAKEVRSNWVSGPMAFATTKLALPESIEELGTESGASGPVTGPSADPVESMPRVPEFLAKPVTPVPDVAASAPVIPFPSRTEFAPRPFQPLTPAAYQSQSATPNAGGARLIPISTLSVKAPAEKPLERRASIPEPGMLPMEYFCQRLRSNPLTTLLWKTGRIEPAIIPFSMRPAQEKLEEVAKKPERKPEPAKVLTLPTAKVRVSTLGLDRTAKIAACLLAAAFLWLGLRSSGFTQSISSGSHGSGIGTASDVSSITASARRVGEAMPVPATGTIARMRRAIASRASVEMTDSFRNGMENWGAATKSWTQGWSRHADGYVRTGELALFGPSAKYQDYRLEFYGQVENKSIGWVVRAQDKQNYYAMKFTVLEPGLRPILALVTYPVVGGKHGHKVTTPLSAMVHRGQPYHVAVDVRGSRFTTSIEGEQVSSFTDNVLASGGIGFFSEAGERARLYWMKVSKNQDWLGRICSMIAGDEGGGATTAEFWGPQVPPQQPAPTRPQPVEVVLAARVSGYTDFNPQRAKITKIERKNQWTS